MKHYLTSDGFARFHQELRNLLTKDRPEVVQLVSWAASNGDRSENGDYLYGKKKLREIDRRIHYLTKRLEQVIVVDPAEQKERDRVFFGASVELEHEDESHQTITIVGEDEADAPNGLISIHSPIAKALIGKRINDEVEFQTPQGLRWIMIINIHYPNQKKQAIQLHDEVNHF